ncbi:MAG: DUF3192 domain-containing protein [Parcubacteria group bacterium]|nr:DUF3192 domain-containing protein [Parcubacteria group bacterium]
MKKIICLAMLLTLVCSQVVAEDSREDIKDRLVKLSLGMSKQQVFDVMGAEVFSDEFFVSNSAKLIIDNLDQSENVQMEDETFEVIYYVTDIKEDDGLISSDELTPIVFNKNRLIGWGNIFLENNIQKYELRNK